jgi:multiple sugar transport system substrate-binding protein
MDGKQAAQGMSRRGVRNIQRGRRGFLTLMGGTGAALLTAACGGNSNNTKSTGAATTAATRAATATSLSTAAAATTASSPAAVRTTPTAAVAANQTVTYIGGFDSPPELDWHKQMTADFQVAFPQYKATGTAYGNAAIYTKMQTALASNSPLDMLWVNNRGLDLAILADHGLLAPVNDVMDDLYKLAGGKDKFDPAAIERYTTATGDVIGVPAYGSVHVWWYRTDLLQEAGLTPPAGHWDWNFLLQAVKATHKPPKVYGLATALGRNGAVQWLLGTMILNNGGHMVSPDLKDVVFDSPEVRQAVDLVKELAQYAPPDATTWGQPELESAIVAGGVAMGEYQGRVLSDVFTKNPAILKNIANTFIPYNKDPRTWGGIGAHGLFKTKNLQAAKELAKFSMRKDVFISYLNVLPGTYASAIPAYASDPTYLSNPVLKAYDPKLVSNITDVSKYAYDEAKEGPGWKFNPNGGAIENSLILADIVQKVTVGKESTASAVTAGANAIRDIMKG